MNQQQCPVCLGEGSTWEDVWLGRHGHSTRHHRCEECDGTGSVAAPEPDDDEPETAEFAREVAS